MYTGRVDGVATGCGEARRGGAGGARLRELGREQPLMLGMRFSIDAQGVLGVTT